LTCRAEGNLASLAPDVALGLYRITQEALRNVIAHAGASRADVRVLRAADHAELVIEDDGHGFDVASSLRRGPGLGLVSITERVRLAGGTVSITSDPTTGTRVRVRIPTHARVTRAAGSEAHDGHRPA
jgi:two-component system sensor histidine kinase UhpB